MTGTSNNTSLIGKMTNALSWEQSTRSFQGRTVSENDIGTWPGSLAHHLPAADGASPEFISARNYRNPQENGRSVSALYSNEVRDRPSMHARISIDGSNLEVLSDKRINRRPGPFTPQLPSISAEGPSSNAWGCSGGIQRSRFANLARRPPPTVTNMKRRSRMPEPVRIIPEPFQKLHMNAEPERPFQPSTLTPPLTPPDKKIRLAPYLLPRLTIPDNQRPAVQEWSRPTLGNISTTEVTSSVPNISQNTQLQLHTSSPVDRYQADHSVISSIESLPGITRDVSHRPKNQSQDISPLETPELLHRIDLPSELDFPDYSFTPQSEASPTIASYARMPSTKLRKRPPTLDASPADGHQSLFSAIYSILRSPSTASTPMSRGSALSSHKTSPIDRIAPLFSSPSKKERFSLSRLTTRARTCACCREKRSIAHYPIRPTARCSHESTTCQDCIIKWIKSSMSNGEVQRIRCPGTDCRQVISYDDVKNLVPTSIFVK